MKSFKKVLLAICAISFTSSLAISAQDNSGQNNPMIQNLPIDPKIRYGKLDNGLTYYIRHNEMPKERAEFYIVQKVGSMQEEENQRGLAHFLEHMAFNGTKNFSAKNGIQSYTESIGMRFGYNLNAYTSFDRTVYMLMETPVNQSPTVVDSCLLVLHDWSSYLLLRDEDIDKERGVIHEEWRTGRDAQMRMWEQQLPKMFPGSKYGERLPIGLIEVIDNFKGDELRAYYKKWYRPDLQAIIIVGDVDVDKTEEKIKTTFADIPAPVNPAKREKSTVPDNEKPIISIATDKEMPYTSLDIFYKHNALPEEMRGTMTEFISNYMRQIVSLIMNERFSEIMQKPNKPFASAYASDGDYFLTNVKGAWNASAIVKDDDIESAMNSLVAETERARRFGFTEAEYDRARANYLKGYETLYNNREKHENSSYANEYARHFTDGEFIPGIETEYELAKQLAPTIPVEAVNGYVKQLFDEQNRERNVVISLTAPEKDNASYPSEIELLNMFRMANAQEITANTENDVDTELIKELPAPGKIVSEEEIPLFDATLFKLSNGAQVIIKHTDFKKDEILMRASSDGGYSLYKDPNDLYNKQLMNMAISVGGVGNHSATDLRKALTGKNVSCSSSVGTIAEGVNGSASPSDIKTLFELIYLKFTNLRTDDDAYASQIESVKTYYKNLALDPMFEFQDSLQCTLYNHDPRERMPKAEDFDKADYHKMLDMAKERFADVSDFTFAFVGNVNKDSIRPLIEQYIASLPSLNRKEKNDPSEFTPYAKGVNKNYFKKKMETPKSSIITFHSGTMPYNQENVVKTQLLKRILDIVLLEKVRYDESATYGVRASISTAIIPEGRTSLQIYFDTDPTRQDKMIEIVKSSIQDIADNGPREEDLVKSRDNMLKDREENIQYNSYWLDLISNYYLRNIDSHSNFKEYLNKITGNDLKNYLKELLQQGNIVEVVMSPESNN